MRLPVSEPPIPAKNAPITNEIVFVADGAQRVAEVARKQLDDHIYGEDAPEIVPSEICVGRYAFQAERAVRHRRDVREDDADYLSEAERRNAEIVAAEPQARSRHQQPDESRCDAARDDGGEEGRVYDVEGPHHRLKDIHHLFLRLRQNQYCPYRHEARVREREHPGESVYEVEADGEYRVYRNEVQHLHLISVEARPRPFEEEREQRDAEKIEQIFRGFLHILSSIFSPISPVGR